MSITLKKIAKKAGVSEATVSLALNDSKLVNANTKKRIKKIARDLDYVADIRGRSLAKKSTDTIALVIGTMDNPFNAELSQFIKNYIKRAGYNLIICTTRGKVEEEANYLKLIKSGAVNGVIFTTRYQDSLEIDRKIYNLNQDKLGIVFIDRINKYQEDGVATVLSDRKGGFKKLINKLINLGHRKIAYVGNIETDRFIGYQEALKENKIQVAQNLIYDTGWNDGYKVGTIAAKKIIKKKNRPTAIACFNDQVAIGLTQYLQKNNIAVPQQISVCGFDNIEISEYFSPALTTVDIPKKDMAKKAVEILLQIINNEKVDSKDNYITCPVKVILRSSVNELNEI